MPSNLPPGCTNHYIELGLHCEVCGLHVDTCICPECPTCHEYGNPSCYINSHGLVRTPDQIQSFEAAQAQLKADAEAEDAWWGQLGTDWAEYRRKIGDL